jgi:hypothetical protein
MNQPNFMKISPEAKETFLKLSNSPEFKIIQARRNAMAKIVRANPIYRIIGPYATYFKSHEEIRERAKELHVYYLGVRVQNHGQEIQLSGIDG